MIDFWSLIKRVRFIFWLFLFLGVQFNILIFWFPANLSSNFKYHEESKSVQKLCGKSHMLRPPIILSTRNDIRHVAQSRGHFAMHLQTTISQDKTYPSPLAKVFYILSTTSLAQASHGVDISFYFYKHVPSLLINLINNRVVSYKERRWDCVFCAV